MFIIILNRTEAATWGVRRAIISVGWEFQDRLRVLIAVGKHVFRSQGYTGHAT